MAISVWLRGKALFLKRFEKGEALWIPSISFLIKFAYN